MNDAGQGSHEGGSHGPSTSEMDPFSASTTIFVSIYPSVTMLNAIVVDLIVTSALTILITYLLRKSVSIHLL